MAGKKVISVKRRDVEREKARIAMHMPHVIAREAAHVFSILPNERLKALKNLATGVAADFEKAYTLAFFECIQIWLVEREYAEAAAAVHAFIRQLDPLEDRASVELDERKVQNY